ncbi:MAG: transporter substrate-binding domain-containing protein [Thermoleophilia bacterium]|nr:transporter substrate-binding domain-containing protein [Thermoleophilia bacterium]
MRRVLWMLALLAAIAALAVSCGDDDDDNGDSGSTAEFTTISDGDLTVCTDAPYEPFEFEGADGEFTGFDMELMRAIATNLNLDLAVTVQPFDGIWLAPEAGTCDLVASAMTITDERSDAALFSDPYFDANQSLLVKAEDAEELSSLGALDGKTIGVQSGTTGESYANENKPDGAQVKSFDGGDALFPALVSGSVDAVLQDFPVNRERASQDDQFVVTAEFETGEQYGVATKKDNTALMDAINSQLAALRDDGTYDTIFDEFFPSENS